MFLSFLILYLHSLQISLLTVYVLIVSENKVYTLIHSTQINTCYLLKC